MPTQQQDFLFVDAAQAKTSRQGRRNARSFVMQNARRKNPWSTSKHAAKQRKTGSSPEGGNSPSSITTSDSTVTPKTATPSPPIMAYTPDYFPSQDLPDSHLTKGEVCPDCHIFRCRSGQRLCPRCILLNPPSPVEVPNNQLFDPFRTSSVEITKTVSELLTHFSTEMAPGIIAVDIRHRSTLMKSDWFGTAIGNPGFMHSLLSTIALHAYVFGKGTFDAILYHRAQAIAAVNAAILTPEGISDANIGAVFNLLTVEESLLLPTFALNEDHIAQLQIHQKGLQRMVQLRGGLKEIKTNRILQAFMLWHSTAHAIASFQAPNPSTLDFVSTTSFPHHPRGYRPNISHHLTDYCRHAGVKETLNALVESVLILIADLNVWFSDPESPLDPLDIQNFACVLECLLLTWLRENEQAVTPLEDALCVALLIFTVRTTEAMKLQSHVHLLHFAASKRLEKALNCTIRAEWQHCPDLLLWILSIGAISAEPSPESTWFVHQTSIACAEFGILSAEALLRRLHLCGWVSYKLNEAACHLWDRVINLRYR
ncbi:Fungal-trans-2 domain containing protein [Pyrenophora tritici-repentis]|uniref:Uncharacterized protein n=1 Tax=Pyrenophora tritici-repentis TaxID=45151 RepID=A0A922SRM5_9PLEO|nr:hypothetical protein A1F94_007849 [Pyrenophora tritici-repentis]KAI0569669.1 hypothetical protein Alg215_11500 [Pyrenophora tritici-repentis]KAI0575093.1 hypothetical protein Alg130_09410 [Pyrenophora tritici-repentis]KAI0610576.1 hypothetical protein TUN205_05164 [Pyrenophora tritici-repentis]KAI0621827.1 hypothetical protein TUN199_06174 [Pyrenophora tritici-repentis]